jgi:hypothetical protein
VAALPRCPEKLQQKIVQASSWAEVAAASSFLLDPMTLMVLEMVLAMALATVLPPP